MLENKLHITDPAELARVEERISKAKALELFETGLLDSFETGTFAGLQKIHSGLFGDVYGFAGKLRTVNIAKGNYRFTPVMYLEAALRNIDNMPQSTFDEIIDKVCGNERGASVPRRQRTQRADMAGLHIEKRVGQGRGLEPDG